MSSEDVVEQLFEGKLKSRAAMGQPGRRFDQTQLRARVHGRMVHRDYAAHFFRWGFIQRFIGMGNRVLDIGCGQEVPLSWVLNRTNQFNKIPTLYLGVDLNGVPQALGAKWCHVWERFNFVEEWKKIKKEFGQFDRIACLEVIEHMGVADGDQLLIGVRNLLAKGGIFFLSTPVLGGKAAANHIHEYGVKELQTKLSKAGFWVEHRWGTFINIPRLKKVGTPAELEVMERMRVYFGEDVVSATLALYHPDDSRNNLWQLRKRK